MKNYLKYMMLGAVVVASSSSCKKFLDINTNPNSLTQATPQLILPQAIVGSASMSSFFSNEFREFSGASANAGGFGGFGATVTYDFSTGRFSDIWTNTYDNANDYEYVIKNTGTDPALVYSASIARIMKAFAFERLVNQFNDVPYSDALRGTEKLQPTYDKGEDVYKACIADLTKAVADITTGAAAATTSSIEAKYDPLFKGDMNQWKKFANTIRLRMLIKMAGVSAHTAYAKASMAAISSDGYLVDDAIVQPGYEKTTRPNPRYSSLAFSSTGAITGPNSSIPTKWMYSFYDGGKLTDPGRGKVIYRGFPSAIKNQLGDESAAAPKADAAGSAWFTGTKEQNVLGAVKGPGMGMPLILAAESNFLQAEAFVRGYLTGNAASAFDEGITQSFKYLYKDVTGAVDPSKNVATDVAAYKTANNLSFLVNFALATTDEQKIEAIITQKYIALNMISNDENFNEFRRTAFPRIVNGSSDALETFASRQSVSTAADKLPSRVLYPQVEFNLNPSNVPQGIDKFKSKIFWDVN